MRTIRFIRARSLFACSMTAYIVFDEEDDKRVTVKNGSDITIEIDEQSHTIFAVWVEGYFRNKKLRRSEPLTIKTGTNPIEINVEMRYFSFDPPEFILVNRNDTLLKNILK